MKVTTAGVALGATPADVRRLIAAGQLPGSLRVGRRVLHVSGARRIRLPRRAGPQLAARNAAVAKAEAGLTEKPQGLDPADCGHPTKVRGLNVKCALCVAAR